MPTAKEHLEKVHDLEDIVWFFNAWDSDGDGRISPAEAGGLDITPLDIGGGTIEDAERPDGFLSPWEVAWARGFDQETTRDLWERNIFKGTAFGSIDLKQDKWVNGFTFEAGTEMEFHPSGRVSSAKLPDDIHPSESMTIPAGSALHFNGSGDLIDITAGADGAIQLDGTSYSRIEYLSKKMSGRTLAQDSTVRLPLYRGRSVNVSLKAGQELDFREGIFEGMRLAAPAVIAGVECSEGSRISVSLGEHPSLEINAGVQPLRYRGMSLYDAIITIKEGPGAVEVSGNLKENATIRVGDRMYNFKEHEYIKFDTDGNVAVGSTAGAISSPYGNGRVYLDGKPLEFFKGRLLEGSKECFNAFFPSIELKGDPGEYEIMELIPRLASVPARVRAGIKEIYVLDPEDSREHGIWAGRRTKNHAEGFATYEGQIVLLRGKKRAYLTEGTVQHEAAHIHTIELDRAGSDFERRWTEIAERDYDYGDHVRRKEFFGLSTYWSDLDEDQVDRREDAPRYGCARSYGCQNFLEDVATHVELVSDGWKYRELVNPNSDYYKQRPGQRKFAGVYLRKLQLLREYGFISHEAYRKALPIHPAHSRTCQIVNCP